MTAAWRVELGHHPGLEIREGSPLEVAADALVNPGNSFGFMDSGLALLISERLGLDFEDSVRGAIREKYGGEMLVGQAEVFSTGSRPPFLIYAPLVRTPQSLKGTINAYLAARAALGAAQAFNRASGGEPIGSLVFPALGTGAGRMSEPVSALQLRFAYEEAFGLREPADQNLSRLARRERKLKGFPDSPPGGSAGAEPD